MFFLEVCSLASSDEPLRCVIQSCYALCKSVKRQTARPYVSPARRAVTLRRTRQLAATTATTRPPHTVLQCIHNREWPPALLSLFPCVRGRAHFKTLEIIRTKSVCSYFRTETALLVEPPQSSTKTWINICILGHKMCYRCYSSIRQRSGTVSRFWNYAVKTADPRLLWNLRRLWNQD